MNKPNIIIADDHSAQRLGVKYHLKGLQAAENIFEADNGQAVVNLLSLHPIDIVIMDVKMPVMSGFEATSVIRRLHANVKVYITSMYEDEALITNLVRMGISGYILKDDVNMEEALSECAQGNTYYSKRIEPFYLKTQDKEYQYKPAKLTPREEKLLPLIAAGKNSQQIASQLSLSKFTVESYRKELLAKFDLTNSTALVNFAHRIGLL
jgi:two-component system, NarL family, nitrate/nitrite response regulator NarL